jgi:hypothetical protein
MPGAFQYQRLRNAALGRRTVPISTRDGFYKKDELEKLIQHRTTRRH